VTYLRVNILAEALAHDETAIIDSDIVRVVWLSHDEIKAKANSLRRELVSEAVSLFYTGTRYPLSILELNI